MAIDSATILDVIHRVRELARVFPGEAGEIIGEGLDLTAEVVKLATDKSPVELLRKLRADLRASVTGDFQVAIDGEP